MHIDKAYDIAIIGGGLAGLAAAIQGVQKGFSVILFEKEEYPFHKVCGEYISMESWNFIEQLGLPLSKMQLPIIKKLIVTAPNGLMLKTNLPLGGFGISRYFIDDELKKIAVAIGVHVYENCKIESVVFSQEHFTLTGSQGTFFSKVCCGSFGKKSNLDIKWQRAFTKKKPNKLNNYIGVKYHVKNTFDTDTIALHNFKNGYCGLSKIEANKYCLCYLTSAQNLKENISIEALEKNVLHKNPHLKKIFLQSEFIFSNPLVISQISFSKKTQIENHVLLLGDAAGMITPLCGNGMSMALHSSKMAIEFVTQFLQQKISRQEMEHLYTKKWENQFAKRLQTGRRIQRLFGKIWLTNIFIRCMKLFPFIATRLIKKTHGNPF